MNWWWIELCDVLDGWTKFLVPDPETAVEMSLDHKVINVVKEWSDGITAFVIRRLTPCQSWDTVADVSAMEHLINECPIPDGIFRRCCEGGVGPALLVFLVVVQVTGFTIIVEYIYLVLWQGITVNTLSAWKLVSVNIWLKRSFNVFIITSIYLCLLNITWIYLV